MKKVLFIIIIFNLNFADHKINYMPYFSPGIQIGYSGNNMFFYSLQVTIGVFNNENLIWPGISLGKRFSLYKNKWDDYNYIDLQFPITPVLGFGIGKLYNDQVDMIKFKTWGGFLGYLSYDFTYELNKNIEKSNTRQESTIQFNPDTGELIRRKYPKHNFGALIVLPISGDALFDAF